MSGQKKIILKRNTMKKTTMNNEIIESNKYDDLINDLWEYFSDNHFYPEDIYSTEDGFVVDIDGDWKHEHITGNILIYHYLEDNNISGVVNIVPVESEYEEGIDNYFGHHVVKIQALDKNLQFKNIRESVRCGMKVKHMNEDYIVEETDSVILSLTSELFDLLSQVKSTANRLIIELEDRGDKSNANFVNVDVLLELEDSNIYDTLEDIAEEYKEGIANE